MKTIKIEKACLSIEQFKDCYLKNSHNENILNSDGSINKNYNSKKKTGLIDKIIEDGWNKMPVDEKNFILKYRKNADIEIKKVIDCHNKNLGCSVYECPECGNNLYRISTKRNNIETVFYYCSTYVKTKKCNKHYILEKELDNIVLESLNKHIELVCEIDTKIDDVVSTSKVEYNSELKKIRLNEINKELEKYKGTNGKVAFVGDGINDSPVLARADVGISMGGVGSGSAIEASDIVVMTDSIDRIDCAIDISKKTSKIIKQNLIFSIGVKIIVLVLSVFGVANMWEAVFADVGATLITVLNSLRILK